MPRPELQAPPDIFYNEIEARKYTTSSRIVEIPARILERALELLNLPDDGVPRLLLDIGCGSGLGGETLSEHGHHWMGYDISQSMLDAALEREVDGDIMLGDMGQGLGLRPGVFDGAIRISAVQWLCYADKSSHEPRLRLKAFFVETMWGPLHVIMSSKSNLSYTNRKQSFAVTTRTPSLIMIFKIQPRGSLIIFASFPLKYFFDL